jgi:hypothetical protein
VPSARLLFSRRHGVVDVLHQEAQEGQLQARHAVVKPTAVAKPVVTKHTTASRAEIVAVVAAVIAAVWGARGEA